MNYNKYCKLISVAILLLGKVYNIEAQISPKPEIIEMVEKSYKLVTMSNGDLLPFVNHHSRNYKYLYQKNKPVAIYEYGMREKDTLEIQQVTYLGDTVRYTEKWDKIHRQLDREWITYKNNQPILLNYRNERDKDTFFSSYYFWEGNALQKILKYKDNHFMEKVEYKKLQENTMQHCVFDKDSNLITTDTIQELFNKDSSRRRIGWKSGAKFTNTTYEFNYDRYGNRTATMVLYNKDSIGDHADFTSYQYTYKNIASKPFHPKQLIGYWVGFDSYRYFYLYKNGSVQMGRLGNKNTEVSNWQYDPVTKMLQIYIPSKAKNKKKTMELYLNTEKMVLTGEDWEFEKREVFKRPILPLIYKSNKPTNN